MLDIDHGTYPFVTSSNPLAGRGVRRDAASGRRAIDEIWGISKAYTTRVGAGPFPSELHDEMGEPIRQRGGEFGTTTGRPRRTGWLDLVALRYAARLNTLTALVVTKLDVLSGLDRIQVCTSYRGADGAEFEDFPYHQTVLHHTTAELTELPRLEGGPGRVPHALRPARRRRASTSTSSPSTSARRSRWSASARGASRSSGPTPASRRLWPRAAPPRSSADARLATAKHELSRLGQLHELSHRRITGSLAEAHTLPVMAVDDQTTAGQWDRHARRALVTGLVLAILYIPSSVRG